MMKEKKTRYYTSDLLASCIFSIVLGFLITGLIINPENIKTKNFDKGYKQGQIDVLNGIQNWDKVAIKDSIYIKIK